MLPFGDGDSCNHWVQWFHPARNRKPWQCDALDHGIAIGRQTLCVVGRQVHHQPDHRDRFVTKSPNSDPAHFDHSCQRRCRAHQQTAMARLEVNPIVANQSGKPQEPDLCRCDERKRQTRLPAPAAPRIRTARAPASTADACTVGASATITSPAGGR